MFTFPAAVPALDGRETSLMKTTSRRIAVLAGAITLAFATGAAAQPPVNARYAAAEGFLPNEPHWTLLGGTGTSAVADNVLTISTTSDSQNQAYLQTSAALASPPPDPVIVEARVKLVSGSASQPDRAPISIAITTAPNVGVGFFIDAGRIFLTAGQLAGGSVIGSTAFVPTEDDFHTYRMAI